MRRANRKSCQHFPQKIPRSGQANDFPSYLTSRFPLSRRKARVHPCGSSPASSFLRRRISSKPLFFRQLPSDLPLSEPARLGAALAMFSRKNMILSELYSEILCADRPPLAFPPAFSCLRC